MAFIFLTADRPPQRGSGSCQSLLLRHLAIFIQPIGDIALGIRHADIELGNFRVAGKARAGEIMFPIVGILHLINIHVGTGCGDACLPRCGRRAVPPPPAATAGGALGYGRADRNAGIVRIQCAANRAINSVDSGDKM